MVLEVKFHTKRHRAGLDQLRDPVRKLDSTVRSVAKTLDLDYSSGIQLFKRLVWEKHIRLNLRAELLSNACLCPDMVIDLQKKAA